VGTQRQIESARINGAKSGPKTLEGKRRSSANARKHGLTSKTISPDPETLANFSASVARYVADLRPASPEELLLIHQMAAAATRRRQAWAAETAAWNRALAAREGCLAKAAEMLAESGEWACIIRYETRFSRQYHCAFEQLLTARDVSLRNEPEPSALTSFRDTILPNEPDQSALRITNMPNEPEPDASIPRRDTILPNEPDPAAVPGRRPCSHRCFLQTELVARRPIRQRARDKIPGSTGQ